VNTKNARNIPQQAALREASQRRLPSRSEGDSRSFTNCSQRAIASSPGLVSGVSRSVGVAAYTTHDGTTSSCPSRTGRREAGGKREQGKGENRTPTQNIVREGVGVVMGERGGSKTSGMAAGYLALTPCI